MTLLDRPRRRFFLVAVLGGSAIAGVLFWGGFNWALEATNTEGFCISCHEMRATVYQEWKATPHFTSRTGVRAVCADCHVPKEWSYKMIRKIQASNEVLHKILGSIDTPEKFEAKRLDLAANVWRAMKATDSRECRNCHSLWAMDVEKQVRPAKRRHTEAAAQGKTCIDCHQGIAHKLPKDWQDTYQAITKAAAPKLK